MLKIVSAPNPVLSELSKNVGKIDKSILNLLSEMSKALLSAKDPVGVGLAAPQVGIPLQIFIAKPTTKSKIQVFINPKIETSDEQQVTGNKETGLPTEASAKVGPQQTSKQKETTKLEGCLSLPAIWGEVKRAPTIKISYMDENSKKYAREFKGFMATIIQHEMDHLNGILFPKRVLEQKGTLYKSHKNEKNEDVFEEIEI